MSLDPSALEPQRDANLVTRIWRAITNQTPDMGPQPSERDTTESGIIDVDARSTQRSIYQLGARTRQAVYADADEMDGFRKSLEQLGAGEGKLGDTVEAARALLKKNEKPPKPAEPTTQRSKTS